MVEHHDASADLDAVFAALSHAARRDTLDSLGGGAKSASELAAPHCMTLAGFMKHLRALEAAGLVACRKEGRTVTCTLAEQPLRRASQWLADREKLWNGRLDALGRHLYQREQAASARKPRR